MKKIILLFLLLSGCKDYRSSCQVDCEGPCPEETIRVVCEEER